MMWVFILVPPSLVIAGAVVVASFLKPHGDHAFAGRADRAVYTGALMEDPDDEPWEQSLPFRVELLTRPGRLDMSPDDPEPDPDQDDDDKTTEVAAWVCDLGIPTDSGKFVDGLLESARQEAIAADWDQRQAEGRSDLEAKVIP